MKTNLLRGALLLICIFAAGCAQKPGPADAAKTFFDLLAAGQTQAAYESAAFGFQAQQTQKFFETTVREMGLHEVTSATYGQPEYDGTSAKLRAEFVTKAGATFPLIVTLAQDAGEWRVYALKSPRSMETGLVENRFSVVGKGPGFVDAVNRQPPPDEETMKKMIDDTMAQFNDALQQKSFADFYTKVARAWQEQLTENQLQRAFQPFIDKEVNLRGVTELTPVLDEPPLVTTEGLLMVSGYYPSRPYRVIFSMKFMFEPPRWKLFGLDISLQQ